MPKTSNSTTNYSLDTDTEESKSQDLCEITYSQSHACMSIIFISDDSSVEESASLAEDRNAMHYEDHVAVQNICTANSLSESTNNPQHTFKSIICISDDSSVQESKSQLDDHNVIQNENPVTQQTFSVSSLGESTINRRHHGNSSVSENLTMGTKRSLHNCPTEVPTFFLTTCEYFEEGSTTHIKLENPNCSQLEDQDFDDKNLLSTSYVPTQKTVLQKCSSAEALETYEYVEHKVPVYNVGLNCDPTSSISYDWNMMDTKLPKKESKSEHSWSS